MVEEKSAKKRKSRSPGQVIERGPDKYLIRVFLGRDSTGKRQYHNETFHGKKKAAQDRLRVLLTKNKAGESLKVNKDTLGTFLDEWLGSNPNLKESSIAHYKKTLDLYIRPNIGKMMLAKVEAGDIQQLYQSLTEHGLARSTVSFVHTLLKSVFKLAVRRRKIPFNPMDGVDSPGGKRLEEEQRQKREARVMTPEQVSQFLTAAAETRFGILFTLAYHTGCRPGELLGLQWPCFDPSGLTLKILKNITWKKGEKKGEPEWYLDTPKTAHGRRTLRLTESLVELLNVQRKRQLEDRMKAGRIWNDHGFIFTDEFGEPYSQNRLRYWCNQILKAAGLPDHFNPYSARHTSATLLMESGVNPKTVSERLGHSDVHITLKTYTHPTEDMQARASEEIERVILGRK